MKRATQKRIKENKTLRQERREGILRYYDATIRLCRQKEKLEFGKPNCKSIRKEVDNVRFTITENPTVDTEWLYEKCSDLYRLLKDACP